MNLLRKITLVSACSVLLSAALMAKEEVHLMVQHFLSPNSPAHTKLIEPWAKKIEKESKGRIKIEIFPSMSMGGTPADLYKQVRDGTVDIVWTLAGYTPGVFTRTEVYELPTVHRGNSVATTLAIYDNFDLIKDDFKKLKPLLVHAMAGNAVHTVSKKITKVEDMKGLKFRAPSRTGAWYIEALGAEAVGMPLPDLPQSLSTSAIDGAFVPFEIFPPYKLHQMTKYSLEGEDLDRFGASVALLLMNQNSFKAMPKDLQKIIENNTGREFYKQAGQIWMDIEEPGKKLQREGKDHEIVLLNKEEMGRFNQVGEKVVQRWVDEVTKKGVEGAKLVKSAREAIAKNGK